MRSSSKPARGETLSGWWYILTGALIGFGLGVAAAPKLGVTASKSEDTLGSRLLKKIPRRIKVAGAVGAAKGAGGEAYRELKGWLAQRRAERKAREAVHAPPA